MKSSAKRCGCFEMVSRKAKNALQDILSAIEEVEEYTSGLDLGDYLKSGLVRRAVERCLEIVSEASRKIPEPLKALHPQVHWAEMRGIGNILRHEYGAVDDQVIWRFASKFLIELKPVIQDLLRHIETQPSR